MRVTGTKVSTVALELISCRDGCNSGQSSAVGNGLLFQPMAGHETLAMYGV